MTRLRRAFVAVVPPAAVLDSLELALVPVRAGDRRLRLRRDTLVLGLGA